MHSPTRARKIFAAILTAFAWITFLGSLQELFGWPSTIIDLSAVAAFTIFIIVLVAACIFIVLRWTPVYHVMDVTIRYWLAFEISLYGFAKIFHTQFSLPVYMTDVPANTLTGFQLTWYYFGYSYTFAMIIAIIQISGAALLIINRTKIAGALLLLPVMLNIVLINIFYDIAPGAFVNSVLFVTALLYVVMPQMRALIKVIVPKTPEQHSSGIYIQLCIAAVVCLGAGYFISRLSPASNQQISGKWEVRSLQMGSDSIPAGSAFAWKRIYIENNGEIIFCSNGNVYSPAESIYGGYRYDDRSLKMKILFENGYAEPDSVPVAMRSLGPNELEWKFSFQKKPVTLQLKKILLHN